VDAASERARRTASPGVAAAPARHSISHPSLLRSAPRGVLSARRRLLTRSICASARV
jgi:hypothetical protein